ncbi:MAG: adenylate/guanylate cyclase domain-containing protein [Actinomycetota bacterium]|nr:adenylate/guanylate cyclase domain-containing protein [Actinomycetota bacterium]
MDEEQLEPKRRLRRLAQVFQRTDASPGLVRATRAGRELLPGDPRFGDELSTAGGRPSQILARHLVEMGAQRTSASRELGLTALQLWQAVSESAGRGHGTEDVAILFTDLVGFSSWALEVGDEAALELLRQVASAVEPAIRDHGGRIVKRLGDGHMAVFLDAQAAVDAALDIQERVGRIDVDGHAPSLRAGVHLGTPRKLGADYLGVDVNVAARVADAADGGEVLVSGTAMATLDTSSLDAKRLRRFRAKGAPRELEVYAVSAREPA